MTQHPLYAAIDTAIAEHGWPDGTKHIGIAHPGMGETRCSITLGTFGDIVNVFMGVGATVADAAAMAIEQQSLKPMRFTPSVVGVAANV